MFSKYKKEDAKPAPVEQPNLKPIDGGADDAPKPKASMRRQSKIIAAQAAPVDKERKRKERLGEIKLELHKSLLDNLNLSALDKASESDLRAEIVAIAGEALDDMGVVLNREERQTLNQELYDEVTGLGPLEPLLKDDSVNDILVNGPQQVFVERAGKLELTDTTFKDERHLLRIIDKIVSAVGRRVDESNPYVDARLADGSRFNAMVPPIAVDGSLVSIRKFKKEKLAVDDLVSFGAFTEEMAAYLQAAVATRLDAPVPGIFTQTGWRHAQDFGAGIAVQEARRLAPLILEAAPQPGTDTPDQVMALMQARTLEVWSDFLADLRVQPFSDPDAAVIVSGTLSRRGSPLTRVLEAVWAEAGGKDRSRAHDLQLMIATRFGPMIQFVEQGRMDLIANLFGSLNVALGTMETDKDMALDRLMNVQQRATSIAALQQAPVVVVQIVEDVLAQTAAAHGEALSDPVARIWTGEVLPQCLSATAPAYPFGPGPDVSLNEFAALLGPGGTLDRFFQSRLAHMAETDISPWRWKPEAALSGLTQDSAAFFQRVAAIRAAFFEGPGLRSGDLVLTPLAERGSATFTLSGANVPLSVAAGPARLDWPGTRPEAGATIQFRQGGDEGRIDAPGPWGLMRLLDPLRLRVRDDGARFLVDLRQDSARFFFEIAFPGPDNPVAGRALLRDFTCPATL